MKLSDFIRELQKLNGNLPIGWAKRGMRWDRAARPMELPLEIAFLFDGDGRPQKVLLVVPRNKA